MDHYVYLWLDKASCEPSLLLTASYGFLCLPMAPNFTPYGFRCYTVLFLCQQDLEKILFKANQKHNSELKTFISPLNTNIEKGLNFSNPSDLN